jgi:iron(III) transport system permease protein
MIKEYFNHLKQNSKLSFIFYSTILVISVFPPFIFLIYSSLHGFNANGSFGEFTWINYYQLFTENGFFKSLIRNVIYAVGSAVIAISIGTAQAWLAERTDVPFRQFLHVTSIISLGIPYVLYIVAWLLLFGKSGPINQLMSSLFSNQFNINISSLGGMIFIEGMMWSPLVFLLMSSLFRNADASFEEAASMSGASLLSEFHHITLGMAKPALFALSILIFVRAIESFEVPALVGMPGGVKVLTTDIYQRLFMDVPPNIGSAASFGCFILLVMLLMLIYYWRITSHANRYRTVTGKGFRPRVIKLGKFKPYAVLAVIVIPSIIIIIPLITVFWTALLPYFQSFSISALKQLSFDNFNLVFESSSFYTTIFNSLYLSAITATLVTGFTSVLGWHIARKMYGSNILDILTATPLVFPAIVLGFAFLEIFLNLIPSLYGSLTSLIIACSIACIPYGLRYTQLGVIQIHPELEDAASICGAQKYSIFIEIIIPLLVPALISCWLFIFLLTARAMSLVLLLTGSESHVMSVTLFDLWNNGQINEFAAFGCIWMLIMTFFSVTFYLVTQRYQLKIQ